MTASIRCAATAARSGPPGRPNRSAIGSPAPLAAAAGAPAASSAIRSPRAYPTRCGFEGDQHQAARHHIDDARQPRGPDGDHIEGCSLFRWFFWPPNTRRLLPAAAPHRLYALIVITQTAQRHPGPLQGAARTAAGQADGARRVAVHADRPGIDLQRRAQRPSGRRRR